MELISKEAVIEIINNQFSGEVGSLNWRTSEELKAKINALCTKEAIEDWVSVNDRLPTENGEYFVTFGYNDGCHIWRDTDTDEFRVNRGWLYHDCCDEMVIAWKLKPSRYEGEA